MAFRRTLFDCIGGFDLALDAGMPAHGGGDMEMFYRTVASGHTLRYEPAALVRHIHRPDDAALQRRVYDQARSFGAYLLRVAHNQPSRRAAVLKFMLRWWMGDRLFRGLIGGLLRRDRRAYQFALDAIRGSCSALGCLP